MPREILIVDKFLSTRALLRNYLRAEIGDCKIREVHSLEEGVPFLSEGTTHLAIISDRQSGMEYPMRPAGHTNIPSMFIARVPTLIILSDHRQEHIATLRETGFRHFLPTPFTSGQLAEHVKKLAPSRTMRAHPRYHLPNTTAAIHCGDFNIPVQVINISRNGVLCELEWQTSTEATTDYQAMLASKFSDLLTALQDLHISLVLPDALNTPPIPQIPCHLVGIKALKWHENNLPNILRLEIQLKAPFSDDLEELASRLFLTEP